jgi:chromosome segregation ATPase
VLIVLIAVAAVGSVALAERIGRQRLADVTAAQRARVNTIDRDLDALRRHVRTQEQQIAAHHHSSGRIEEDVVRSGANLAEVEAELRAADRTVDSLRNEIDRQREQLDALMTSNRTDRAELAELRTVVGVLETRREQLRNELFRAEASLTAARSELASETERAALRGGGS